MGDDKTPDKKEMIKKKEKGQAQGRQERGPRIRMRRSTRRRNERG